MYFSEQAKPAKFLFSIFPRFGSVAILYTTKALRHSQLPTFAYRPQNDTTTVLFSLTKNITTAFFWQLNFWKMNLSIVKSALKMIMGLLARFTGTMVSKKLL